MLLLEIAGAWMGDSAPLMAVLIFGFVAGAFVYFLGLAFLLVYGKVKIITHWPHGEVEQTEEGGRGER